MGDDTRVDLNFKVDPEFRQQFKAAAVDKRIFMNALLKECFERWGEFERGELIRMGPSEP